jgi:hypothetical protein
LAAFIKECEETQMAKDYGIAPVLGALSSSKMYLGKGPEAEGTPAGEEGEVARGYMTALFSKGWAKPGPGDNWCLLETHDAPNISFNSYASGDKLCSHPFDKRNPGPSSSGGFLSAGQA